MVHSDQAALTDVKGNIFILPSYVGFDNILNNFDLSLAHNRVISNNPSMIRFCADLGIPCTEILRFPSAPSMKEIRETKLKIKKLTRPFSENTIYHFFYRSEIASLYAIKVLRHKNTVQFYNCDPIFPAFSLSDLLRFWSKKPILISWIAFSLVLWMRLKIYKIDQKYTLGISHTNTMKQSTVDMFLRSKNIGYVKKKLNLTTYKCIYFDNISQLFPKQSVYCANVLKTLNQDGFEIFIKPHPQFDPHPEFSFLPVIDRSIPSEVLVYFTNYALGVSTLSLNAPSSAKKISLINMLGLPDEFVVSRKLNLSSDIHCPGDFAELKAALMA